MRTATLLRLTILLSAISVLGGCATLQSGTAMTQQEVQRIEANAMHAYHDEHNAQALALYRDIVELDPEHAKAWFRVGNLLAEKGELLAAIDAYQRALALRPDYTDAMHNLALVHIRHGAALLDDARDKLVEEDPDAVYRADRYLAYLLTGLVRGVDIAVECDCE